MMLADPEHLKEWVEFLAVDIGRRPAARPDLLRKAADRISAELAYFGFEVSRQPVPYRQTAHANIIAAPPGSNDADQPLLVVGAHYDSVSRSPGADDNASGIAGLLEIARLLRAKPLPGLRLAAFCPEEPPAYRTRKMGSYVYAESLKKANVRLKGMICLEMIGYFRDEPGSQSYPLPLMNTIYPKKGNFIAIVGNIPSTRWTRRVRKAFAAGTDLPAESLNAPAIMVGIDFSDHWSFNKFGFPAAMVTDTAFYRNPHYHLASDLPATLDYTRMAKVVDGLAAAVRLL
ncbi:MAG: M28 family peptidase [Desulfobulbaceae bacterium]|nr:M28 family peptidase [Desulfobulbaceae bacterium]